MRLLFAGTPAFAVPILAALHASHHSIIGVYTQPDRPAGRGRQLRASPVKLFAEQHQLPLYQPVTLRHSDEHRLLESLQADAMIVAAYGLLLPLPVLSLPRYGCINVHPSLLPRWRGAAPIQRPLLAGDKETGVTIMQMDQGLDTGPLLYKVSCAIEAQDTAQSMHDKLAELGASALLHTLTLIETGLANPEMQDNNLACYAPKISKEEAQIDWTQPAEAIVRAIHAYNPMPIAYSYLQQQLIRIWQATALSQAVALPPGTIFRASPEGIDIASGNGLVRLQHLQLSGAKVLSSAAILNARATLFQPGECFHYV